MIFHTLRIASRNIFRYKRHTVISLSGLVIGLASVFVIFAWTLQELHFDRFYDRAGSIHMVTTDIIGNNGDINTVPETPAPLAEALEERIPEIENACHFIYLYGGRLIKIEDRRFKEVGIAADAKLFDVLSLSLMAGTPASLQEPNTILLTEDLAQKLYPSREALGESLLFDNDKVLVVRGIIENMPENSSLQLDYIVPYQLPFGISQEWWQLSDATFIKIRNDDDLGKIKSLAQKIFRSHISDEQYNLNMIPITRLRYDAKFDFFNAEHGNIQSLFVFDLIAILILVLAVLNYINLLSANYLKRTSEVTIRKIYGAGAASLMGHFVLESQLLSIVAWLIAIPFSFLFLRLFQSILEVSISMHYIYLGLLAGFFISLIVVGFLGGIYPGMMSGSILTSFRVGDKRYAFKSQYRWKHVFIVSQFILLISLIIASLVIFKQTAYMRGFDVGYEKDHIIQIYLPGSPANALQALRDDLRANPSVESTCLGKASPVHLAPIVATEGWTWKGLGEGTPTSIYQLMVDHNYLNVFNIPVIDGRFFSSSKTDQDKIVINEKLAALMGFDSPLGQTLVRGEKSYVIIGVVKDFHFQHLINEVHPLLFLYSDSGTKLFVKINRLSKNVLDQIENEFNRFSDQPFTYDFIASQYDELYKNESKLTKAILVFTLLSIALSYIGLIGLISFATETRIKEIAIRKVCGASINRILILINMGILRWILLGVLISWTLSWIALNRWLEGFSNRITLEWWFFVAGALIVLVLTILTISFQSWKAASSNPVGAIKYE